MSNPTNNQYSPDEPEALTRARVEAMKQAAERDKQQAEYYKQQARYQEAQADRALTDKAINEIRLRNEQYYSEQNRIRHDHAVRLEKANLMKDGLYGTFHLDKPIHDDMNSFFGSIAGTVQPLISKLELYHRENPEGPIELIFNSPGGEVNAGMRLFDYLQELRLTHRVTCGTRGRAASMAGVLLQAGDHRWMGSRAKLLIHEGSGGAIGTPGSVRDRLDYWDQLREDMANIFVERSNGGITMKKFKRKWDRKDWWLSADEALRYGFIDEIR